MGPWVNGISGPFLYLSLSLFSVHHDVTCSAPWWWTGVSETMSKRNPHLHHAFCNSNTKVSRTKLNPQLPGQVFKVINVALGFILLSQRCVILLCCTGNGERLTSTEFPWLLNAAHKSELGPVLLLMEGSLSLHSSICTACGSQDVVWGHLGSWRPFQGVLRGPPFPASYPCEAGFTCPEHILQQTECRCENHLFSVKLGTGQQCHSAHWFFFFFFLVLKVIIIFHKSVLFKWT
jgi:hypothetical protein